MAMLGAGAVSGGFVSRAVSYAAGSQMRDATRQHMPSWAGGERVRAISAARATDSRLGARLSAESVLAASKAAGAGAGVAAGAGAAAGVASRRASRWRERDVGGSSQRVGGELAAACAWWGQRARVLAAAAREQSGAVAASGGLQRPSWRQDHFDAEMLEASLREQRQPVSAEQARQALDALPASTQGAVQSLVADHGPRARQHLAYQALGEWTPHQREAIRTLAAASPEVRAQAFSDGSGSTSGFGESADPKPTPAGSGAATAAPSPARSPAGNGGNGTSARKPQDQPPPDRGGGS